MLLYSTWDTEPMSHHLGAKLGRYKHIIVIAVTIAALGAYFLPLSTVFAGHNGNSANANKAARDAILKGHSSSSTTKSNSGTSGSSSGSSSPTTKSNSGTSGSSSGSSSPTTKSNRASGPPVDNSPQVGDNIGHGNKGHGNIGNGNNGIGNIGNHNNGNGNCGNNLNGNGNVGNNGNGLGGGKYGGPRGGALCDHGVRP